MLQSKRVFVAILNFTSALARNPRVNPLTRAVMRFLAFFTSRSKHAQKKSSVEEIGLEWQRMFPDAKDHPIKKIENGTVYAEIHTQCPLRGTGDVHACYRLMEYDRSLVKKIGGEFVVLRSQAEPGVAVCQVAVRRAGTQMDDLTPAHERRPETSVPS